MPPDTKQAPVTGEPDLGFKARGFYIGGKWEAPAAGGTFASVNPSTGRELAEIPYADASDVDRADWRWTVDTAEDLEFVRRIYQRLGGVENFSWNDVVGILEDEPELMWINSHVRQKEIEQA